MSVTLTFSPETEKQLRERAAQSGQSVEGFIQQVVEREVLGANGGPEPRTSCAQPAAPPAGMTFDEILAPIRRGFQESGLTEEKLDALFEEAREEVWQEKQKQKGPE